MANRDKPCGARPQGRVRSAQIYEAGSTVYPGDFVRLASDGQVDAAAAGNTLLGVALGYATSGNKVLVSDHKEQRYVLQADEAEIDAQTDVGNSVDILATAGDSTYKISRHEMDSSTLGTTSGQLWICDIQQRPDNAFGANVDVIVKINEAQNVETFAGV